MSLVPKRYLSTRYSESSGSKDRECTLCGVYDWYSLNCSYCKLTHCIECTREECWRYYESAALVICLGCKSAMREDARDKYGRVGKQRVEELKISEELRARDRLEKRLYEP